MSAVVEVWLDRGPTSVPDAGASSSESVLDEVERDRLARLSDRVEARTYEALHVLARRVIGERLDQPLQALDRQQHDRQHGLDELGAPGDALDRARGR